MMGPERMRAYEADFEIWEGLSSGSSVCCEGRWGCWWTGGFLEWKIGLMSMILQELRQTVKTSPRERSSVSPSCMDSEAIRFDCKYDKFLYVGIHTYSSLRAYRRGQLKVSF